MIKKTVLGLALAASCAGLAEANQVRETLESVNTCTTITDAAQRLACYDAQAPKVRASLDVATEEDRVTLFGLDLFGSGGGGPASGDATRPEDFGKRDLPPPVVTAESGGVITEITVALADVGRNGSGYDVYVLDNGQVWRQKEAKDLRLPRNAAGVKVKIRQGSLGAYYLSRDGQNSSVPVERVK
jgi:ABC-type Fe3+-hydroxamate transport system substrate-binding protein